jgi:hypothetical protein
LGTPKNSLASRTLAGNHYFYAPVVFHIFRGYPREWLPRLLASSTGNAQMTALQIYLQLGLFATLFYGGIGWGLPRLTHPRSYWEGVGIAHLALLMSGGIILVCMYIAYLLVQLETLK